MNLDTIRVLYRDENLQLWGIPYEMRREIGQSPRHLAKAGNTKGWVWLGSPGWWGSLSGSDQEAVKAFLDKHRDAVPGNWYEFSTLSDWE